jgi:hypothetical protein
MPAWYVHMQAAAETMEKLNAGVPPGSPLTQAQANDLFTAAHNHRNYLAAGALGPDLFFLLPDFKGDQGKGLLELVEFVLTTWKALDETFLEQWETWMGPVADNNNQLANSLTGGMLGEIGQVLTVLTGSLESYVAGLAVQMKDVFGIMSSGTQTGFEDNTFFWSDMFHYRKTYQFARRLYANALKADVDIDHGGTSAEAKPPEEPSRVPKQQAFALGWISHCATDVAAHPWTNAKCGGPYRTHWQRHHVIENHMDARIYGMRHPPTMPWGSLDTAALHFRIAFQKSPTSPDPTMPDDEPLLDYFPGSNTYPMYLDGETANEYALRRDLFDKDTEPLPEHICELLLKTMQDVYTGPDDMSGPRILAWDPGQNTGTGGRPTVEVLQNMFDIAFAYSKFSSSSGLAPRPPMPPPVIGDHDIPRPPGLPADGTMNLAGGRPLTFLDILLAILAFSLWILELLVWIATVLPTILLELSTWPLRQLIFVLLLQPAWDLYMLCRKPLVMEGFLAPRPSEISTGLVQLGADEQANGVDQLRADLNAPMGVAADLDIAEPEGLDMMTRGAPSGFGLDPAYPRAMVTDRDPPYNGGAAIDAASVYSEFVAPWRYPDHNMAGMRVGWEAPGTHVGPYMQGDDVRVLMAGMAGSDAARRLYEQATTPAETEAVSASLLATAGSNLGDPLDYGAYLMGWLTGSWQSATAYQARDWQRPLPDFNLDSDRGYGYQCWDYTRHASSTPPGAHLANDAAWPDQWRCAPRIETVLSRLTGRTEAELNATIRDLYGYNQPLNVPQRYEPADNPHHRSRYDPLKHLAHHYLRQTGFAPLTYGWDGSDLQVTEAEMRAAGMSPTGRKVP